MGINGIMTFRIGFRSAQCTYQSVQSLAKDQPDTEYRKTVPGAIMADSESKTKPNLNTDAKFKPHNRLTQDTVTLSAAAKAAFRADNKLSLNTELLDDLQAMAHAQENAVANLLNFAQFKDQQLKMLRQEARHLEQKKQTQPQFHLELINKQIESLETQIAVLIADELNEPDEYYSDLASLED